MLDAQPRGKSLGRHRNPLGLKPSIGVVRGLTGGEYHVPGHDLFGIINDNTGYLPSLNKKIGHSRIKTNLAAQLYKTFSHIYYNQPEAIGPDVGMGVNKDVGRPPAVNKNPFYLCRQRIFGAAGQFSIGKRPRSSLSETDVAFGVKNPLLPERCDVKDTLWHWPSPLQQNDRHPPFGNGKGREKPCGPAADNNRPLSEKRNSHRRQVLRRDGI